MNRLSKEKSAYLKHSADQKIDWYPWSEAPFLKAEKEDKPLFLSSGGVWCHWCHVMAKECFYDDDIAAILNENFISIKVDRDERPDIDRRYQLAVNAMGLAGGWPLSVFLTHEKKPFYGGTYFPPEDRYERPGIKKILSAVLDLYKSKKDDIADYTEKMLDVLQRPKLRHEDFDKSLLVEAVEMILREYDPRNGGFGKAPKFPVTGAMEFLINRYCIRKEQALELAVKKTLESMAGGGIYDHVGGGFHRYSTDEFWIIPHFEKMADDNAWLLRNYLDAYVVFGDEIFKDVSKGIIQFVLDVLSDPEGGFYSSQDADVTPDDEGGYFTWTEDNLKDILDNEEYEIMKLYFFHEAGIMHHDSSKRVLFPAAGAEEIAAQRGMPKEEIIEIILRGKAKMLEARNRRETPFIDTTFYTSLNGMLIASFLKGYRILKDNLIKDYALKSLDKIMSMYFINRMLFHTNDVEAFLDDYINLIDAVTSAYEVTRESAYLERAVELMDICVKNLWDEDEGGFFDTGNHLLGIRIKGIEDIPHPSANSVGILLLLKLYGMTGNERYRLLADTALKAFYSKSRETGIHAGYYFCALDAYFNVLKLTVNAPPGSALAELALSITVPHAYIVYGEDNGTIVPCIGNVCHEPVGSTEGLKDFLTVHGYNKPDFSSR
jgi:uncharacterized protein YyaL (SSP411 family)